MSCGVIKCTTTAEPGVGARGGVDVEVLSFTPLSRLRRSLANDDFVKLGNLPAGSGAEARARVSSSASDADRPRDEGYHFPTKVGLYFFAAAGQQN